MPIGINLDELGIRFIAAGPNTYSAADDGTETFTVFKTDDKPAWWDLHTVKVVSVTGEGEFKLTYDAFFPDSPRNTVNITDEGTWLDSLVCTNVGFASKTPDIKVKIGATVVITGTADLLLGIADVYSAEKGNIISEGQIGGSILNQESNRLYLPPNTTLIARRRVECSDTLVVDVVTTIGVTETPEYI